ncbi:MAG: hypothetical protein ABS951_04700 [Solibacillus sp.]
MSNDEHGFLASLKNLFQPTPENFTTQLEQMGIGNAEQHTAKKGV